MTLVILTAIITSLLLAWLIKTKFENTLVKNNYIFFNIILVYVLILIFTLLYDLYLDFVLQAYDINNDGIFSKDEQSLAQEAALYEVTNDTARNLIPFIGLFYAVIYGILLSSCIKLLNYIKNKT